MVEPRGWFSRGYLPHFDGGEMTQSLCFHLIDSIPRTVLEAWHEQLASLSKEAFFERRRRLAEQYLDRGAGPLWLNDPALATLVQHALLFFDNERYRLHAWVIMPNHVHALFTPMLPHSQHRIANSWKSFTANEANRALGRTGHFWAAESYDRYIRTAQHFNNVKHYIEMNLVNASLCAHPEDWPWSSASYRIEHPEW